MLSEERNRLLCQTGPVTAMGELLRRYWHPVAGAAEFSRQTVKAVRIFLPGQLRDFQVLQSLGRQPRLTVGPWTHLSMDGAPVREVLEFGLAYARGEEPPPRSPVRLYVMGEDAWRDFESWPPAGYAPARYYLEAGGVLTEAGPVEAGSEPDRYRYDPADPTPAADGVRMNRGDSGRMDNTAVEARPDVLTYTTAPLPADTEVIGEVSAEIWFSSSLPSADVFVRLCDVDTSGRSWNVCDGLTRLLAADQSVYHDPARPSAITLPISCGSSACCPPPFPVAPTSRRSR